MIVRDRAPAAVGSWARMLIAHRCCDMSDKLAQFQAVFPARWIIWHSYLSTPLGGEGREESEHARFAAHSV